MPKYQDVTKLHRANVNSISLKVVVPYHICKELELEEGMSLKWELQKDKVLVVRLA